ncbi:hypothetical protein S40288_04433 [Stachybotrys chartarum IBT 40288]|nr:hypothetical protein S40288_04433 [Stachybotrys chartarum IBT 40288]
MTPLPPDPYKILGVSKDAQITEIRSAHRKLVLKCHPDKVQDPALKAQKQDEFQKVQQAYELLSDDSERAKYDDQVKLAELRKLRQAQANSSVPRSSPKYAEYEIRTAEPRPSSYRTNGPSPTKSHTTYSKSWEEDTSRGPRIFEAEIRTRREQSYTDKPSKRNLERERDPRERDLRERDIREREARDRERELKDRDARDRDLREQQQRDKEKERERERERKKRAERDNEAYRRHEKDKEARKVAEKRKEKEKDKQREKEIKREREREADEKKKYAKSPYIEEYEIESPLSKSDKKKSSSSKKQDEKRERSSHRAEVLPDPVPAVPTVPEQYHDVNLSYAALYIEATRAKSNASGIPRSKTYLRDQPPAVPTPPPAPGMTSVFPVPDEEDIRRSSAKARRGSSDTIRSVTRDKAYKKSSREFLDDQIPEVVAGSPRLRHHPQLHKSATTAPAMASSPPRHDLPRTKTMPIDPEYSRPTPGNLSRAQTFSGYGETAAPPKDRGRSRSRMHSQIQEEYESEDEYEAARRERKHRSSKKDVPKESVQRYHVSEGRTKAHSSFVRPVDPQADYYYSTSPYSSSGARHGERPPMPPREAGYSSGFPKIKTSKAYGAEDIHYSPHYHQSTYRDDYPSVYA